jgi:hypothetical protein
MPQANDQELTRGQVLTANHNGVTYRVEVESDNSFLLLNTGTRFTSLTACRRSITGQNYGSGRPFFGLPVQRRTPRPVSQVSDAVAAILTEPARMTCSKVTGKCKQTGCYEPADCKHGYCQAHCTVGHSHLPYSSRTMPRNDRPHVGVEIEVVYRDAETLRRGLPLGGHSDGSLGSYGAEYKVLAESDKISGACADLLQELFKRGARVNRSCGLHVHLDVRQLSDARRREVLAWLERTQDTWFSLVPPSRRNNTHVQRIPNSYNHYQWANLTSYNTLEIRIHGGTMNHFKLDGWLSALTHLQAKALDASFAFPNSGNGDEDFWALFADCPAEGREYLRARQDNAGVIRDRAFRHVEE